MTPYGALITPDQLDAWMAVRFGPADGAPLYWHANGLVRDLLSGEPLYTFEYYDVSRQIRDPQRPEVRIGVARKVDAFRDKDSNAVLEMVNGQKVGALLYPYQMFDYWVEAGEVRSSVTQGSGDHLRVIPSAADVWHKQDGDVARYTAPSHFPFFHPNMPGFEDFFTITVSYEKRTHQTPAAPLHSWALSIVSRRPPWAGGDGEALVTAFLSGIGTARFEELPPHIQDYVRGDLPAWEHPPQDLEEIKRMQEDAGYLHR